MGEKMTDRELHTESSRVASRCADSICFEFWLIANLGARLEINAFGFLRQPWILTYIAFKFLNVQKPLSM